MRAPLRHRLAALLASASLLGVGCGGGGGGSRDAFYGTQSPGDAWTWTLDVASFTAENLTLGFTYSGAKASLASGFLKLTVDASTDPDVAAGDVFYALEVPDTALLVIPTEPGDSRVVVATAQGVCPFSSATYNWVALPPEGWDATNTGDAGDDDAYGRTTSAFAGGSVAFTTDRYRLDGTLLEAGATEAGFVCADGVLTNPDAAVETTIGVTPSGALVGDLGPGAGGFVGIRAPAADVDLADVASRSYRGVLFKRNVDTDGDGAGDGVDESEAVRAVPGAGADAGDLVGNGYVDVEANTLDLVNGVVLRLSSAVQASPGVVTGTLENVADARTTDIVVVVGVVGGRVFLFGITLRQEGETDQPVNFLVVES